MIPYHVLLWDINHKVPEWYDIMPYFIQEFKSQKKNSYLFSDGKEPKTFDDFKNFILHASRYRFWSRCEYEIIVSEWPYDENDPLKNSEKIDAYQQIESNIDAVTYVFMFNIFTLK